MKVLVTGATGLIGKEIGKALVRRGHEVFALSRNAGRALAELPYPATVIEGDLTSGPLQDERLNAIEAVIHLAGENVGDGRWTEERKKKILSSRVEFSEHLVQSLPATVKVFVSSSATGYYGNRGDEILTEKSLKGLGFLSDVCEKWENAVRSAKHKISSGRFVILRTGVVLSPFGGALTKMLPPFQMGLGGVLGSGHQWISWIHIQDLVELYMQALENPEYEGIYNAVAPEPVTNRQWTDALCDALKVNRGLPVPAWSLKALYGEMSSVILESTRVVSERLTRFPFHFATITNAFAHCCCYYEHGDQVFFAEQYFPLAREKVFSFFSRAENLETITPPLLNFRVESVSTPSVQQGTLIDYILKIHGVPVQWRTLIEEWRDGEKFVDTQLKGPYQKWHHTHTFEDLGPGTIMRDVVRYKLPVGLLGQLVAGSFVRGDVEKIFDYRRKTVPQLLNASSVTNL